MTEALDVEAVDLDEVAIEPPPSVPVEDILRQHYKRYVIHTKAHGDIVLKHLTRRSAVRINALRVQMYPEVPLWEDELQILAPLVQANPEDSELLAKATALTAKLLLTCDLYATACIVSPRVTSPEAVEELMDMLEPVEAECLRQLLLVCTRHAGPCDMGYLEVAERWHVEVIDRPLMDNMTREQYETLQGILRAERTQEMQLLKSLGVRK